MKKFFMFTPQQPEGKLAKQQYEAKGNSRLAYGETHFPIVPVINGYADEGDEIQVITITYDQANCAYNLGILKEELDALAASKKVSCELVSLGFPFDDSVGAMVRIFRELVRHMEDDDIVHACITFGSKPLPIVITMALRYAYRTRNNLSIKCVVYGQRDWSQTPAANRIYDVTALLNLEEAVRGLEEAGVDNPDDLLDAIMGLGE